MEFIDLGKGWPDSRQLPYQPVRDASWRRMDGAGHDSLQYAPTEGFLPLRESLSQFLSTQYGHIVEPANLALTTGASHGLDWVLQQFTQPGDTVFVEDPTYFYALGILRDRGLQVVPVRMTQFGIDLRDLEQQLNRYRPRLLYTIPTYHNPTGVVLSDAERKRLVEIAQANQFVIVADDVYQLLGDAETPPPIRHGLPSCVVSLGSFSKILAPGVRLGWIEAPPEQIERLLKVGVMQSSGGVSPVMSAVVDDMIRRGTQEDLLLHFRQIWRKRLSAMVNELQACAPPEIQYCIPQGGYFLWLQGPEAWDAERMRPAARRAGVDYRPGPLFSSQHGFAHCLRLCCTYYDEPTLITACQRLAEVIRADLRSHH